jgi:hypothetical protein
MDTHPPVSYRNRFAGWEVSRRLLKSNNSIMLDGALCCAQVASILMPSDVDGFLFVILRASFFEFKIGLVLL